MCYVGNYFQKEIASLKDNWKSTSQDSRNLWPFRASSTAAHGFVCVCIYIYIYIYIHTYIHSLIKSKYLKHKNKIDSRGSYNLNSHGGLVWVFREDEVAHGPANQS
jgi:hypothetical protein